MYDCKVMESESWFHWRSVHAMNFIAQWQTVNHGFSGGTLPCETLHDDRLWGGFGHGWPGRVWSYLMTDCLSCFWWWLTRMCDAAWWQTVHYYTQDVCVCIHVACIEFWQQVFVNNVCVCIHVACIEFWQQVFVNNVCVCIHVACIEFWQVFVKNV